MIIPLSLLQKFSEFFITEICHQNISGIFKETFWAQYVYFSGRLLTLGQVQLRVLGQMMERELQTAVDPLYGVAFVLGDDAFLNVRVHLLVHKVLQLGEVII